MDKETLRKAVIKERLELTNQEIWQGVELFVKR